ncbi:hypothetical protein BC89_30965 [Pseudomonas monteilii]|nr:hypothetical protein BC89_30965 [Pseudomonas monteilii]
MKRGNALNLWEILSCVAGSGLIAGKPDSHRYCTWLEGDEVEVGAGLPAIKVAPMSLETPGTN